MKISRLFASRSRFLLTLLLAMSFVAEVKMAGAVTPQSKQTVRETRQTQSGVTVVVREINEIPEATEPCAPEVSEWWNRVRKAGYDLQKKNDEKSKTRFYLLLYEGQQNAFRIPLKDRPAQRLAGVSPALNPNRRQRVSGAVELSVDYGADASVADIHLIKGVRSDIDAAAIQATRRIVFLPAVKNGAFVTEREKIEYKFSVQ